MSGVEAQRREPAARWACFDAELFRSRVALLRRADTLTADDPSG